MAFDYLKHMTCGVDKHALFDELMMTYGRDVWNYAYFITKRKELAEDISQDVFVKAYEHLDSFRGGSSIKSWLLSITRNTALDYLKTAWMRRVQLFPSWFRQDFQRSAESEWFGSEEKNRIWSLVLELPRKQREVLILFAHYRLSMKEIAELLDISEGTVKSRLHRARQSIGSSLSENAEERSERL
ncbi:RNA polymerase sigma factor [Cohnella sp. LGH]|uniref:RNA polymerase sigma factor n=1 Tax=Cohnella sp. LGH TaxID=1619153 RepID=UPI001FFDF1D0|nr:sigma-70 family RNA polymerase sigma factor [Cohnella sp. LGH]